VKIVVTNAARENIIEGFRFYEEQVSGLGQYYRESIYSDIDSLEIYAGVHEIFHGAYYRLISKNFPFAIYHKIEENAVLIHAVLDCRRHPDRIKSRLG